MQPNEQLLIAIHQNAEMGKTGLEKLREKCADPALLDLVNAHYEEYKRIYMAADTLLKACEGDDSGAPAAAKLMSGVMLDFAAMKDSSVANFADMMLKGTEKGLKEIDEAIAQFAGTAKTETVNLAETLRAFLLHNKSELLARING